MSEQTSTTEPTTEPVAPTEPTQGDPAELGDAGKRALDAERKRAAEAEKREKALEARLKEFEDAQKTAEQRAADEAVEAKREAEAAKVEALRWRIAAKHGISDTDAETFLTGTDEASMTAQAERLVALSKDNGTPAPTPRPDLTQGASGKPAGSTADLFAAAAGDALTRL